MAAAAPVTAPFGVKKFPAFMPLRSNPAPCNVLTCCATVKASWVEAGDVVGNQDIARADVAGQVPPGYLVGDADALMLQIDKSAWSGWHRCDRVRRGTDDQWVSVTEIGRRTLAGCRCARRRRRPRCSASSLIAWMALSRSWSASWSAGTLDMSPLIVAIFAASSLTASTWCRI